jgi:ubiquinone/menaquinone biosynthesis C-methylase UbiE
MTTDRLNSEQAIHDRQAHVRSATFCRRPEQLQFLDDAYLDHETWIRPAFRKLGNVAGLKVLDFGCGHGMAAVVLARRGARVTALDLSRGYLSEARDRAHANGLNINFIRGDGEKLPFPDGSFDRIWGNAILHHLDVERTALELFRVLRAGGLAVFCEPWGENPVLSWARSRLPYAEKDRTPDEKPLRRRHVRWLRSVFPQVDVHGYQLLSMARRVLRPGLLVNGLDWCDDMLLSRMPRLQHFCRYVVLTLHR